MPTVKVNDLNTYCEIHGVGEPLVNIRGKGMETTSALFSASRIITEFAAL